MSAHTSIRSAFSPISDQMPRYGVILLVYSHLFHFVHEQEVGGRSRKRGVCRHFGLNFDTKVILFSVNKTCRFQKVKCV